MCFDYTLRRYCSQVDCFLSSSGVEATPSRKRERTKPHQLTMLVNSMNKEKKCVMFACQVGEACVGVVVLFVCFLGGLVGLWWCL